MTILLRLLLSIAILVSSGACAGLAMEQAQQAFMVSSLRTGSSGEVMGYCPDLEILDIRTKTGVRESGHYYTARCQGVCYRCVDLLIRTGPEAASQILGGGKTGTRIRSCHFIGGNAGRCRSVTGTKGTPLVRYEIR